jgi:methylglutaconyl-CoA hydratase
MLIFFEKNCPSQHVGDFGPAEAGLIFAYLLKNQSIMTEKNHAFVDEVTENGITTIRFFHPKRNALPGKILADLADAITRAGGSPGRVVVLQSLDEGLPEGKTGTFCSGASFDELIAIRSEAEGLAFFSGFAKVINAMRKCPKLIIGRIHGKCVGGGVGLAAAVDLAIAVRGADVKLSELVVGIGPFVVGPAVERKLGLSAFSTLAIKAGDWQSGEWAFQNGLYAELHDSVESMDESIGRIARTLADSNPEAMRDMKRIFWQEAAGWDDLLMERAAVSGRLVLSDFTRQAIERFKQKSA